MVVLTAETCWALNEYWINNKISGIKLVSLYSTIKMMHGPINIRLTFLTVFHISYIWTSTLKENINLTFLGNWWGRIRNKETPVKWGMDYVSLQRSCVTLRHCSLSVFIKIKSPWSLRFRHQVGRGNENSIALSPLQRGSHSHWTTFNKHRWWILSENISQVHYTKIRIYLGVTATCDRPNKSEYLLRS